MSLSQQQSMFTLAHSTTSSFERAVDSSTQVQENLGAKCEQALHQIQQQEMARTLLSRLEQIEQNYRLYAEHFQASQKQKESQARLEAENAKLKA